MLLTFYRTLTVLGAPFIRAYLRRRLAKGREDAERFPERFGVASVPRPPGDLVWCHAASVGEAASLLMLIEKIHDARPDMSVLVTTGTVTAARMLGKRLPSYALHQYVPIDLVPCVERFLDTWRPTLALWAESELWPNTLAALRRRSIPALLLNARMSEKSFRRWRRLRGFAQELLSTFSLCLAQTANDQQRYAALGAKEAKCVGNLKYVAAPLPFDAHELAALQAATKGRALWLMASTHPGEEEGALAAHRVLSEKMPNLLTLIAPRHPVRGDEVATLIEAQGLVCARRSKGEAVDARTQIYLLDTLGEMGLFYALSPLTVIGGSFGGTGGHNPIEPAQLGSALIFGPSMFNFSEIEEEFIANAAALRVSDARGIPEALACLMNDPARRERQAHAARALAEEKRKILDKIIAELTPTYF